MTVGEIAEILSARTLALENPGAQAAGCFVCDIMSRTLEKGFRGMAWITYRADMNALAVAVMKGAACLIFPEGIEPEEDVVKRAGMENMPLILSEKPAFELAGRIHERMNRTF